ncbi:MAG: D-glycero-alpha-D-manno-heptose-1,7-bisphosphate 7-phosphatase [Cyclobacteriaceae bacterium]
MRKTKGLTNINARFVIQTKNKCVFLDRDGVINHELGDYAYRLDHFKIIDGVIEALQKLKENGYLLIIVTNQAGIAKNLYTEQDVRRCHQYLQNSCSHLIDDLYFSPHHPTVTESLLRKPDSLMFEKAIAKYKIDPFTSWMIGDTERDILPAKKLHLKTIGIGKAANAKPDFVAENLLEAADIIIKSAGK